jgi:hypothetical protein
MRYILFDRTGGGEVVSRAEETSKEEDSGNPDPSKEEKITPRIRVPHR